MFPMDHAFMIIFTQRTLYSRQHRWSGEEATIINKHSFSGLLEKKVTRFSGLVRPTGYNWIIHVILNNGTIKLLKAELKVVSHSIVQTLIPIYLGYLSANSHFPKIVLPHCIFLSLSLAPFTNGRGMNPSVKTSSVLMCSRTKPTLCKWTKVHP